MALARDLLLLDEPFAALGPALKAEMMDLVVVGQVIPPMDTASLLDNPPPALKAYLG